MLEVTGSRIEIQTAAGSVIAVLSGNVIIDDYALSIVGNSLASHQLIVKVDGVWMNEPYIVATYFDEWQGYGFLLSVNGCWTSSSDESLIATFSKEEALKVAAQQQAIRSKTVEVHPATWLDLV